MIEETKNSRGQIRVEGSEPVAEFADLLDQQWRAAQRFEQVLWVYFAPKRGAPSRLPRISCFFLTRSLRGCRGNGHFQDLDRLFCSTVSTAELAFAGHRSGHLQSFSSAHGCKMSLQ
jgi:hypothetical protein